MFYDLVFNIFDVVCGPHQGRHISFSHTKLKGVKVYKDVFARTVACLIQNDNNAL